MHSARVIDELQKLLGKDKVNTGEQALITYTTDFYPRNQIRKLGKQIPPNRPLAVCFPEDITDVQRILDLCRTEEVPFVPFGAGSGVCGSANPSEDGLVIDVKRMNRILKIDPEGETVTVQPGFIGEELEYRLNAAGYTLGHFPSSIACSTVGGYVACRSAGQFSSHYGKFEDMTLGLELVLPDGTVACIGMLGNGHPRDPAMALFLGSEGTLGIVTRVLLRIAPLPEATDYRGFAFLDVDDGLACMRRIMQAGIAPTVLRLYDPLDSLIAGFHGKTADGEDIHQAVSRLTGIKKTIASVITELNDTGIAAALFRPGLVNRAVELLPARALLIVGVVGKTVDITQQWDVVRSCMEASHGEDLGPDPGYSWLRRRYSVSYKQSKMFMAGAFVDTMEVATTWENLAGLYRDVVKALSKHVFVMAHFSHAYPQGCSIYFTFAGYRPSVRAATSLYQRTWQTGLAVVNRYQATISHHHGIGSLKRFAMGKENQGGRELFTACKEALDPGGLMNPGKLY
jgi:alkyldihydroxyacetonephosphate synthase